ncbi:hypothetical protein RND81_14G030200 [Saponaria officinalis]|uniref:Uncharacterized protein n=1 Tax=Saponaria officinalis TaxID=3572 RepID=A0AAW1GKR0_SAPOF
MGCGESKHAVATTESFSKSKSKKLNSQSSKKVHNVEQSNGLKVATDVSNNGSKRPTIGKSNSKILSTNISTTSPDVLKKESPTKVVNVDNVTNNVKENISAKDDKEEEKMNQQNEDESRSSSLKVVEESAVKEDEKSINLLNDKKDEPINVINVEEPYEVQEKQEEKDNNELLVESHDDQLSMIESQSSSLEVIGEPSVVKEDEKSIDKIDEQINITNVVEPIEVQEKQKEKANNELSPESQVEPSSSTIESQSSSLEVVEEPVLKEEDKSIDMLNDKKDEQMNIINVVEPSEAQEKQAEKDNIVESVKKEDVDSINLTNEINKSTNEEDEVKNENSSANVADEIKKEGSN